MRAKRFVRIRADDHVAIVLKDKFPDRVENVLPMSKLSVPDQVDGVEINVAGLTRKDLENEGLSANEIRWILANS